MTEIGEYSKYYELIPQNGSRTLFRPGWGTLDFDYSFKNDMKLLLPYVNLVISTDTNHRNWAELATVAEGLVKEIQPLATEFSRDVYRHDIWSNDLADIFNDHSTLSFKLGGRSKKIEFYHRDMALDMYTKGHKYAMVLFGNPTSFSTDIHEVLETFVKGHSAKAQEFHNRILEAIEMDGLLQGDSTIMDALFPRGCYREMGFELLIGGKDVHEPLLRKTKNISVEELAGIRSHYVKPITY